MGYSNQIFSGVFWTALQTIVNRFFSFFIKLYLARILFPEDYGIVGMATVFIAFISVFNDLGLGAALVQRKEEELSEAHYHTAFWSGLVFSFLVFLFVSIGVARFASWFYKEPILESIIPVLGLGILASPINLVHRAILNKRLEFKKLAFINNISSLFSGILALTLAYLGAGVWSLVFNSVSLFVIGIPLYFIFTKWYPKLIWSKDCFQDIFGFGINTVGTNLFVKFTNQIDYLLIGKLIGASSLGIYSFAFILTDNFRSQITGITSKVMYPIYAKMQDDVHFMRSYFLKVVKYNAYLVYPIMTSLILLSDKIIPYLFGDKWNESVIIVKILCGAVMVQLLANSNTDLIRSSGRANLEFRMQIIKSLLFYLPLILIGTYFFGILGAAIGFFFAKTFSIIYAITILDKIFGITFWEILKTVKNPILFSLGASIISVLINFYLANWFLSLTFFFITYSVLSFILGKKDFSGLIILLKNYRKKNN